ncbi:MAG: putative signal transducing protein, partial [Planctomycetota bacterium]
ARFAYSADPVSEAELARIKLEAEGIGCFLAGKNFAGVYWLASHADRGVKLQVRESDAERAKEILSRREKVEIDESEYGDSVAEEGEMRCPWCDSEDVKYEKFSRRLFYLGIAFLRFPVPFPRKKYRCNNCGEVWK